jgi:excisionase family DNA binding protein
LTDSGKFVSPLQLSRALGLGESTVKRWIDQGRVPASKTPGGHRRIPLHAALGYVREAGLALVDPAALGLLLGGDATPQALRDLLAAGLPHAVISLVERVYAGGMTAPQLADDWIAPAMTSIGHDWETGDLPVTREHSASSIATRALHALLRTYAPAADRPLAFVAGLSGDPYVLAGLCAELTLCEVGYRVVNFGADTPLDSLADAVKQDTPALVALSLSTPPTAASSDALRARLAEAVRGAGSALILGGRGMRPELVDELGATAWCRSMRELQRLAEHLRAPQRSLSAAV